MGPLPLLSSFPPPNHPMLDPCTWFLRASYLRPSTIHTCFFPSQKKRDDGRGKLVGPTAPTSFGSTPPMPPFGIGSNAPLSCTPLHHSGSGCDREGEREGEEDRRTARGTGSGIDASEMPPVRLGTCWSFARTSWESQEVCDVNTCKQVYAR